jgi:membrane peptidoglycan carboxypeptidase
MYEAHTSALQAYLFARYITRLSYAVEKGDTSELVFSAGGPWDERLGYARLPAFRRRLEAEGFRVAEHAHVSPELARLLSWKISPPYPEATNVGLFLRGAKGATLYDARQGERVFGDYRDIPPLIANALVFIENQELFEAPDPRSNPAVEWDRIAKASLLYVGSKLGFPLSVQGGSTLAIQLEKFRHSPGGRTGSPQDKLRQMTAASLKAYRTGMDTTSRRQEILVEYLNMVPLAAAPGYGEVYGLGNGLHAWFHLSFAEVCDALRNADVEAEAEAARAYRYVLTLLAALPAPSHYLLRDRDALQRRVERYLHLMIERGIIEPPFAAAVDQVEVDFAQRAPLPPVPDFVQRKAATAVRIRLSAMLGIPSFYELDRLHLEADSTIDTTLQSDVVRLFRELARPEFVAQHGLREERLLGGSDPGVVLYSLLLFERVGDRNYLRVQADNLDQPFDINRGVKLELGSTAKLRTLAHYLGVVTELYQELVPLDGEALRQRLAAARDPITKWTIELLLRDPKARLDSVLDQAIDRRYSASPGEVFFTGSGTHQFSNFDPLDNGRVLTVRESLTRSVNLVFVRLMRDLVRFHQARLSYNVEDVLSGRDEATRLDLLRQLSDSEAQHQLTEAYKRYQGMSEQESIARLLGRRAKSARHLTILFFAWHPDGDHQQLTEWLRKHLGSISEAETQRFERAYARRRDFTISDWGYLLSAHPLDVWMTLELRRDPDASWDQILASSATARDVSNSWLFKTRNRRAQDRRLRIRAEQDAFARMTPYWRRLAFPFSRLIPSYATAIGSSGDRPAALAELMGIIVNDGVRLPSIMLEQLRFASGTPYEVAFTPAPTSGEPVMDPAVARVLRTALANVVENGTARRLAGVIKTAAGQPVRVGGKTGTGDNRFDTVGRSGGVRSSRAVNRTATFTFYIGDRYFGVLTAFVPGKEASRFRYTSALPVSLLKLLGPTISARIDVSDGGQVSGDGGQGSGVGGQGAAGPTRVES